MKKVVIESHIPAVPEQLAQWFDVVRLTPEEITPEAVKDASALIVRTRTRCDAALLEGSSVSFVATATIGTDHIDILWCKAHGIKVVSAPGCNAPAVAQYVCSSIARLANPAGLTLGVVGVGHVGSIVANWARQMGMTVLECDPPRADVEGPGQFHSIDYLAENADVITFHVPHTTQGLSPTHHMADERFFASLRCNPIIINSARGAVVDTPALVAALERGQVRDALIDCWEGEPDINPQLLRLAAIATPHIAGYSLEGKLRATAMTVNALCRHFGVDYVMTPMIDGVPVKPYDPAETIDTLRILSSYDPSIDTARLRAGAADVAPLFERLRNTYPLRREP